MEQFGHVRLESRVAFVTGAAGGLGKAMVHALLERGATVVAADVNSDALASVASEEWAGSGLHTCHLDIADAEACAEAVSDVVGRFGSLDILVNNGAVGMGVIRPDHMTNRVTIDELTPQIWDRFVDVNLSGAWYLTQAAVPQMKRVGWGRIINVTTSFFTMLLGEFHPYGPIKAALEAMSSGHAAEFAGTGVTVNVIVPGGPADTGMVTDSAAFDRRDLIPPTSMVPPLLWLCSAEADEVTGRRYVGAHWSAEAPIATARQRSEAPIGWPELTRNAVWPDGNPR